MKKKIRIEWRREGGLNQGKQEGQGIGYTLV
jgi:hypothetical protein